MKLIILLAVAALSSGAKLDRTYLPPSYAQTSGGNGQLLQAPESFPANNRNNDFTQATSNRFTQSNNANYQNNDYEQNSNDYSQDGNNYQNDESFGAGFDQNAGFDAFNQRPERPQAEEDRSAAILRLDNNNDGETYNYAYETSNGIAAEENGVATDGVKAQGGYSYTGDDGQVYSVRYTADENGFVPQGDHLPTPPPIPEEILKALEKNAQDEANGIYDDGSYNEGKYGNGDGQQNDEVGYNYNNNGNNFNAGGNFNNVNTFNNGNSFNAANNYEDSVITENALLRSNDAAFGKQNGQFGNQNGVEKAYLPPFQNNERAEVGLRKYNPAQNGFNNQANRGFNSQNGVEKAYLPPKQFSQNARSQADANTRYNPQNNGFRNQANGGFSTQNDVQKTYLPPQFGQRAQQSSRGNGAGLNRAYLPPNFERANQNAASRSFSAQRNGGIRTNPSDNVERSYLPPNAEEQTQRFRNQGFRNTGSAVRNGASREYLPPSNQGRNSFV